MTIDDAAYREAVDYLVRYGEDDWMMLSVVVSEADNVLGNSSTNAEVVDMTMRLAAVLLEAQVVPGDLVADDRLPMGADICWFHKINL